MIPGEAQRSPVQAEGRRPGVPGRDLLLASLAAAAALLVYSNAIGNGFTYDDHFQIEQNPWLRQWGGLGAVFTRGSWEYMSASSRDIADYYRPLFLSAYLVIFRLFGPSPAAFHLFSVILHGTTVALFYLVAVRAAGTLDPGGGGRGRMISLTAALVLATHPVNTESVAWIGGLPDVLFTFFGLVAFSLHMAGGGGRGPRRVLPAAAAFFAALLCKETAAVLPAVFLCYDVAAGRGRNGLAAGAVRYASYGASLGLYLLLRIWALGGFAPTGGAMAGGRPSVLLNGPVLVGNYLLKLLLPAGLSVVHDYRPVESPADWRFLLSLAGLAAAALLAAWSFRHSKTAFLGLCLVFLPLLPPLYSPTPFFAERHLYLPSAGLGMAAGALLFAGPTALRRPASRLAPALLATGILAALTVMRTPVYRDDISLWEDALRKSPTAGTAHFELAVAYTSAGRTGDAEREYLAALRFDPGDFESRWNLAGIYLDGGRYGEAAAQMEAAVLLRPEDPYARQRFGIALFLDGRREEGMRELEAALRLNPDDPRLRRDLERAAAQAEGERPGGEGGP